jgi:hypothetical protein
MNNKTEAEKRTNNYGTTTFTIKLRAAPGRDAYRELKGLLKVALRRHGFKCTGVTEEAAKQTERSAA